MLGKLMKHEWKNTCKVGGILLLFVAVFTVLGCISMRMPALYSSMNGDSNVRFGIWDVMGLLTFMLYVIMLMGVSYGILIYLGVHFYRSMFTDEGYLTHTLPVNAHQVLLSKVLIGGAWMLLESLAIVVSVVALVYAFCCMYLVTTPVELTELVLKDLGELFAQLPADTRGNLLQIGIWFVLILLIGPLSSVVILFGSITLGQLFKKYRAMMAIVCYIAVSILLMILVSIVQIPISIGYVMNNNPMGLYKVTYAVSFLMSVGVGILMYFVSHIILTKKFDIE